VAGIGAILVTLAVLAGVTRFEQPPVRDELSYHLPSIRLFAEAFPAWPLHDYPSASGPVPYAVWGAAARITGLSLPALRAVTFAWMLVLVAGLTALARQRAPATAPKTICLALYPPLVVFSPYCLPYAFTVYPTIPALALAVWGLVLAGAPGKASWWGGAVLGLAVASRQVYVTYCAGIFVAAAAGGWVAARRRAPVWLAGPVVLAALGLVWGGTTSPAFRETYGAGAIHLGPLGFYPVWLGFWFAPVAVATVLEAPRTLWIWGAGAVAAAAILPSYVQVHGLVEGVLPKLLAASAVVPWGPRAAQAVLAGAGCVVAARLVKIPDRAPAWIVAAHAAVLCLVPLVWERYYQTAVPLLWLALLPPLVRARPRLTVLWLGFQTTLTLVYATLKWGGG